MSTKFALYIEQRVIDEAYYIINNRCTIRECAKFIGVSKSTVCLDINKKLKQISVHLYNSVKEINNFNYSERHKRGGKVTKMKYLNIKKGGNKHDNNLCNKNGPNIRYSTDNK